MGEGEEDEGGGGGGGGGSRVQLVCGLLKLGGKHNRSE